MHPDNQEQQSFDENESQRTFTSSGTVIAERRLLQKQLMKQICYEQGIGLEIDNFEDQMVDQIDITDFAMIVSGNASKNDPNVEQSIMMELMNTLNQNYDNMTSPQHNTINDPAFVNMLNSNVGKRNAADRDFFTQSERSEYKNEMMESNKKSQESSFREEEVKLPEQQQQRNIEETLKKRKDNNATRNQDVPINVNPISAEFNLKRDE